MNKLYIPSIRTSGQCLPRFAAVAAILISALASTSLHGQPGENTLACAGRPSVRYAVVVDLSSSLNSESLRRSTINSYHDLFSLLLSALCEEDIIHVYNFPASETSNLTRVHTGVERLDSHSLLILADSLRNIQTESSDLRYVLQRIEEQIVSARRADVVFLLTDGSLYPYERRRRDSPAAYAAEAKLFLDVSRRLTRNSEFPLYVLGVGAHNAFAIDRDALRYWRVPLPDTLHVLGYPSTFNLAHASGHALLRLAFGHRYAPIDSISMTRWLFGESDSWLQRARGYESVSRFALKYLANVTVRHLIYTMSSDPDQSPCEILLQRHGVGDFMIDVNGRKACSVASPSRDELRRIVHRLSEDTSEIIRVAYLPDSSINLRAVPDTIYAAHQLVIGTQNSSCEGVVLNHVREGHPWPRVRVANGRVDLIPNGHRAVSRIIPMVPIAAGCSVVLLDSAARTLEQGSWLAIFSLGEKAAMKQFVARQGAAAQHRISVRMGGFPFLADSRAARITGCVQLPVEHDQQVHDHVVRVVVPGKELLFERAWPPHCSALGDGYSAWGVSHIAVTRGNFETGYILYGPRSDSLGTSKESEWYPRAFLRRGAFFLSPRWLVLLLASALIYKFCQRWRQSGGRTGWPRFRECMGAGIYGGLVFLVFVQFFLWLIDTDWWRVGPVSLELLAEIALQIALVAATQIFPRPSPILRHS